MKYMLLVYMDENAWAGMTESEQKRAMAECNPHIQRLQPTGKFLGGAPLQHTSTATTLRLKDGKKLVTDGPFAETREQLGGYALIEADDLDDALRIASGFLSPVFPTTLRGSSAS